MDRRDFMKAGVAASAAGAMLEMSFEEKALLARPATPATPPDEPIKAGEMPMGQIGKVKISRVLCGGNLISGYAHSRDLIYVSSLLNNYFTDEKIMDTWQICEEHGVNTMTVNPNDDRAVKLYGNYLKQRGGKLQWLAQIQPSATDLETVVKQARDNGAAGAYLVGNLGDQWVFDNRLDLIDKLNDNIKKAGMIAGVAGHSLQMPIAVESAGIDVDFYFKTLHSTSYWSSRRPDQNQAVINNYAYDNYWDMTPPETIEFMSEVKKPWIAYKVLAAGAIRPREGFEHCFKNGADFACVGMFDWQVGQDVAIATQTLARHKNRKRAWMA